jgi:hypothetical protein
VKYKVGITLDFFWLCYACFLNGVVASWCYTSPKVNDAVDALHDKLNSIYARPHWDPRRELLEDNYRSIDFPFEPVEGVDHTGPFEFEAESRRLWWMLMISWII